MVNFNLKGRFADRKEFAIVFGVMMLVMLPVRILLVEYVSDDWWGSFGAISAIAILMVILVKKKKLGKFGEMFERQMLKLHKSIWKYDLRTCGNRIVNLFNQFRRFNLLGSEKPHYRTGRWRTSFARKTWFNG